MEKQKNKHYDIKATFSDASKCPRIHFFGVRGVRRELRKNRKISTMTQKIPFRTLQNALGFIFLVFAVFVPPAQAETKQYIVSTTTGADPHGLYIDTSQSGIPSMGSVGYKIYRGVYGESGAVLRESGTTNNPLQTINYFDGYDLAGNYYLIVTSGAYIDQYFAYTYGTFGTWVYGINTEYDQYWGVDPAPDTRFTSVLVTRDPYNSGGLSGGLDLRTIVGFSLDASEIDENNPAIYPDRVRVSLFDNQYGDTVSVEEYDIDENRDGLALATVRSDLNAFTDYTMTVDFVNDDGVAFEGTTITLDFSTQTGDGGLDPASVTNVLYSNVEYIPECSIGNLKQCIIDIMVFLFQPSPDVLDQFSDSWQTISTKKPFGYVTMTIQALTDLDTNSAQAFSLGEVPFQTAIFDPFKLALGSILWGLYAIFFYQRRLKHLDI